MPKNVDAVVIGAGPGVVNQRKWDISEPNTLVLSGEAKKLPEGLIVISSVSDCLRLCLLSAL